MFKSTLSSVGEALDSSYESFFSETFFSMFSVIRTSAFTPHM